MRFLALAPLRLLMMVLYLLSPTSNLWNPFPLGKGPLVPVDIFYAELAEIPRCDSMPELNIVVTGRSQYADRLGPFRYYSFIVSSNIRSVPSRKVCSDISSEDRKSLRNLGCRFAIARLAAIPPPLPSCTDEPKLQTCTESCPVDQEPGRGEG